MKEFDYIVVGGGSGGCAVAGRLSEDPDISICLLETGKSDDQTLIKTPFCTALMLPTSINNWAFETVPSQVSTVGAAMRRAAGRWRIEFDQRDDI